MTSKRRDFLKLTAGLALAPSMAACGKQMAATAPKGPAGGPDQLAGYFEGRGYRRLDPHDLIAPYDFNGGLRYDDEPLDRDSGKWLRVQNCGRIEDIAKRDEEGVLAYFHIVSLRDSEPAFQGELFTQVLDSLIVQEGLRRERIVLVSTEWFSPFKQHAASHGLGTNQFVERSLEEAMAAGDGSGLYRPADHPNSPEIPTVAIHYALSDDAVQSRQGYPLSGHIELAEVSLRAGPRQDIAAEEGGIGAERVKLAQGLSTSSFEDTRVELLAVLDAEAARREVALPEAYSIFATP